MGRPGARRLVLRGARTYAPTARSCARLVEEGSLPPSTDPFQLCRVSRPRSHRVHVTVRVGASNSSLRSSGCDLLFPKALHECAYTPGTQFAGSLYIPDAGL